MTPEQWEQWSSVVEVAHGMSLKVPGCKMAVSAELIVTVADELRKYVTYFEGTIVEWERPAGRKLTLRPWEWASSRAIHGYAVQTDSLVDLGTIFCDGTVPGCPGDWVEGWPDGTIRTRHEGDRRAPGRVLKAKDEPDSTFSPG